MPKSSPPDEHKVLIKKLTHACASYDSAARKYLAAVKALDSSLEAVAVAIRELSQGEENEDAVISVERFCTSVDRHMAGSSAGASSGHSKTGRLSDSAAFNGAEYPFAAYMSDFTREISSAVGELKEILKKIEKSRSKQDDLVDKYNKKRSELDTMEMKLAKKNQGISTNEKYSHKLADRDSLKVQVETGERELRAEFMALLQRRTQTLLQVVRGMQTHSSNYYSHLSKAMQA
ncbi:protein of unknown function - conserved [Leishmania donovani]|uniref:Hypothetical_protein_conserved n=1 Tax=Leishmania donovani TaxID=5661 RepID=A0A3Q8ICK8_LEIDO|nr:hypothetical protein, unknown function [Leishmania donovani]AYU79001.1 hypothetical protein LdCL_230019000 [Leishmania donovani]TPP50241.1 hypothetical protein CGC21_17120 [Leishmania donovani]TPP51308.1 hypothetical protein CGC20_18000 [Leishmania donovani]CAJ1988992.1 protein of unknown function - conserved [Leishmania donovani]CBZ34311.1 hypothetical protein, unknown function [Leishmania donovani]